MCNLCSERIVGTVLKALEQSFHPNCFTCSQCPLCLDGVQFYMAEDKKPLCQACYARYIMVIQKNIQNFLYFKRDRQKMFKGHISGQFKSLSNPTK